MNLELDGKVAAITGGTRGIGLAIARALAAEGCAVAVCGRGEARVRAAVAELEGRGARAWGAPADVVAPRGVEDWLGAATSELGGLDLLVANVGGSQGGALLDSTPEDWTATWELNAGHAVRAIRAAVEPMASRGGGSAVVISSISGWMRAARRAVRCGQGGRALRRHGPRARARAAADPRQRGLAGLDPLPGRRLGASRPA